jgi:hypothetical protein
MKQVTIDWSELELAFQNASWEATYYLDLETDRTYQSARITTVIRQFCKLPLPIFRTAILQIASSQFVSFVPFVAKFLQNFMRERIINKNLRSSA